MGCRSVRIIACSALLFVPALVGCGSAGDDSNPGVAAYRQFGCGSCHGSKGQGLRTAPPLRNLSSRWTEDELVAFLRNPRAVRARRPQLEALAGQYPVDMAGFPNAPEETLRAVARYVLEK
jgi:cytochrome c553